MIHPDSFECQCIPRVRLKYVDNPGLAHRSPIECWTQDDEDRKNLAVFVVAWVGDEDCGARNDGPTAVYRTREEAMKRALDEAQAQAKDSSHEVEPVEGGFGVGRDACRVYDFSLQKPSAMKEGI